MAGRSTRVTDSKAAGTARKQVRPVTPLHPW